MLNVTSHEETGHVTVNLAGRLDGSDSCKALTRVVKSRLHEGHRRFLIDLAGVEWMSSCGIGCLIATYTSVRRAGGDLALCSPNSRVQSVLEVTDLVPAVFELVEPDSASMAG